MKTIALLAVLILGQPLQAQTSGNGNSKKATVDSRYQLLWEITRSGSSDTSYIFGSLHSNDRRLFNMPDSVYVALDQANTIVLETDIFSIFESFDTRKEAVKVQFDRYGNPYTSSTRATPTSYGDEDGMPQFLDAFFEQYCFNVNKPFAALEPMDFQVETLEEIKDYAQQDDVGYESFLTQREDMLDLYLTGNIYKLHRFVKSSLSIIPEVYQTLIVDRNIEMTNRLDSLLQGQSVFCAVGAGHLAGNLGILDILKDKGYKVRKVMATYAENPPIAKTKVLEARSYELYDEHLGLHVQFPGKPLRVVDSAMSYEERWLYSDLGQGNTYEVEVYLRGESVGSWSDAATEFIPAPKEITFESIELPNGGEAIQGLGQEYWDWSLKWVRILMTEEHVFVLKASGGNKFMNSSRAFTFFDSVYID